MSNVSRVLSAIEHGDPKAASELLPLVYDELRKLAAARLVQEKPGQTLQSTALVHEAYLRLVGDGQPADWGGRGHFFATAAEAMRRILIDRARRKNAIRHGGGRTHVPIDDLELMDSWEDPRLLAIDDALTLFAGAAGLSSSRATGAVKDLA